MKYNIHGGTFNNALERDCYLWENDLNKDHEKNTTERDRKEEDEREKRCHRAFKKETGFQHRYLDPIMFDEEFFNWLDSRKRNDMGRTKKEEEEKKGVTFIMDGGEIAGIGCEAEDFFKVWSLIK